MPIPPVEPEPPSGTSKALHFEVPTKLRERAEAELERQGFIPMRLCGLFKIRDLVCEQSIDPDIHAHLYIILAMGCVETSPCVLSDDRKYIVRRAKDCDHPCRPTLILNETGETFLKKESELRHGPHYLEGTVICVEKGRVRLPVTIQSMKYNFLLPDEKWKYKFAGDNGQEVDEDKLDAIVSSIIKL